MIREILRDSWKTLTDTEEWKIRLLGLKRNTEHPGRRGLILVQIDGLSYADLKRAMGRKHMPFLHRLIRREHYHLRRMYSGIPSNTPAFQGEFFFGKHQCVPAFQYRDRTNGSIYTMFEKKSAAEVEKGLLQQTEGLIAGGTSYGNIFSGGAAESHLCISTADFGTMLKTWNPYSLLVTVLLSPFALVRGIALSAAEILLAFWDVLRGCLTGQDVLEELKFILTRVTVSILFREVMTAHARVDIYRGMPVIHVNYFGYDEQAHRRGPSTRFAYWSLSGIDAAIRSLWYAAAHAKRRHYDVWIYSDHGQEKVLPFAKAIGKPIPQAVHELYAETYPPEENAPVAPAYARQKAWGDSVMGLRLPYENPETPHGRPLVTTLGPISQIYFPVFLEDFEKREFALSLIERYPVLPVIVLALENGEVEYITHEGIYSLPEDKAKLLGADHPYLDAVVEDLQTLLRHENRGDLMLFGWRDGLPAITFSNENGAHAGFGPHETQAFALLPADVHVQKEGALWIRNRQLREAALEALGRKKKENRPARYSEDPEGQEKLRVMSYNVHSCIGLDRVLSIERIARVIARSGPDIVALQELDVGRRIKGGNQASAIACELEMHFHFHAVCGAESECFGNAILSRYPMRVIRAEHLPMLRKSALLEPRGVLWVEIDYQGSRIHVLNTHLSIWGPEQRLQVARLLEPEMLDGHSVEGVILCGDFNMTPGAPFYGRIRQHFEEPRVSKAGRRSWNTWTSQWPIRRLDHIFTRGNLQAELVPLHRTRLETYASDHLPTVVDIHFRDRSSQLIISK